MQAHISRSFERRVHEIFCPADGGDDHEHDDDDYDDDSGEVPAEIWTNIQNGV